MLLTLKKLLHTRETQLMICTASCAVSHRGLAGSTALTQTCAARDRGFLPHFYCLAATMLPQTAISNRIPSSHRKHNLSLESVASRTQANHTAIRAPRWIFREERLGFLSLSLSPTLRCVMWLRVVRREVSRWRLLTLWSWASCFNKSWKSSRSFLTVRNVPSGLWKWRNIW